VRSINVLIAPRTKKEADPPPLKWSDLRYVFDIKVRGGGNKPVAGQFAVIQSVATSAGVDVSAINTSPGAGRCSVSVA
jgi:hypothetical protein